MFSLSEKLLIMSKLISLPINFDIIFSFFKISFKTYGSLIPYSSIFSLIISLYKAIDGKKTTREIYADRLIAAGDITAEEHQVDVASVYTHLDSEFEKAKSFKTQPPDWLQGVWQGLSQPEAKDERRQGDTSVKLDVLRDIGKKITSVPGSVNIHRTLKRIINARFEKVVEEKPKVKEEIKRKLNFNEKAEFEE